MEDDERVYISLSSTTVFFINQFVSDTWLGHQYFLPWSFLARTGVLFEGASAQSVFCAFQGTSVLTPFNPSPTYSYQKPGWKLLLSNPYVVLTAWVASGTNKIANVSYSVSIFERRDIAMISF